MTMMMTLPYQRPYKLEHPRLRSCGVAAAYDLSRVIDTPLATLAGDYSATLLQNLNSLPTSAPMPRIRMSQPARPANHTSAINRSESSANQNASHDRSSSNPATSNHSPLSHMSALDVSSARSGSPNTTHRAPSQASANPYFDTSRPSAHIRTHHSRGNHLSSLLLSSTAGPSTDTFSLQPRSSGLLSSMEMSQLSGLGSSSGDLAQRPLDPVSAFYLSNMSSTADSSTSNNRAAQTRDSGTVGAFGVSSERVNDSGTLAADRTSSVGSQQGLSAHNSQSNLNLNMNINTGSSDLGTGGGGLSLRDPRVNAYSVPLAPSLSFGNGGTGTATGGNGLFGTWTGMSHGSNTNLATNQISRNASEDLGQRDTSRFGTLRDSVSDLRERARYDRVPEGTWETTSVTDSGGTRRAVNNGDFVTAPPMDSISDYMTMTSAEMTALLSGNNNNQSIGGAFSTGATSGGLHNSTTDIHTGSGVFDYSTGVMDRRGSSGNVYAAPLGLNGDGTMNSNPTSSSGYLDRNHSGGYPRSSEPDGGMGSTSDLNGGFRIDPSQKSNMNMNMNLTSNAPNNATTNTTADPNVIYLD